MTSQGNATASPSTAPTPTVLISWDMPSNSSHFFPHNNKNHLTDETSYFVWTHYMCKAYSYCRLLKVVSSSLTEPMDATTHKIWWKMDAAAPVLLTGCIKAELVVKIVHLATTNAA